MDIFQSYDQNCAAIFSWLTVYFACLLVMGIQPNFQGTNRTRTRTHMVNEPNKTKPWNVITQTERIERRHITSYVWVRLN